MRRVSIFLHFLFLFAFPAGAWPGSGAGGEEFDARRTASPSGGLPGAHAEESVFPRIWALTTLFRDDANPLVQSIAVTGRYHGQYAFIHGNGQEWQRWDNRRIRIGLRGDFLREFSFNTQVDLSPDSGPFYTGLTDAYVEWHPRNTFRARAGKQTLEYTYEGSVSSNEILTTERSLITENVWKTPEYVTGGTVSGDPGRFIYSAGVFAGDEQKELSRFDAGYGYLLKGGYDFGPKIGVRKALLRSDYFYNDSNPGNTAFRQFRHTGSLSLQLQEGKAGLNTDFIFARGFGGQPDVFGVVLMPFFNFMEKWQAVLRYTWALSAHDNGLSLVRHYEQKVASGKGNEYNAFYLGLNYYIYGHRLKLMGSFEYSNMRDRAGDGGDFSGWTAIAAARLSF
ncbi:MAG TPA: porin [Thermodesulfobacteriota bacterium]|nr:porin [Thermodesulfobacteriota bacterium]